jgi:hypothetical protein
MLMRETKYIQNVPLWHSLPAKLTAQYGVKEVSLSARNSVKASTARYYLAFKICRLLKVETILLCIDSGSASRHAMGAFSLSTVAFNESEASSFVARLNAVL